MDEYLEEARRAQSMQCCLTFVVGLPMTTPLTQCQTLNAFVCANAPRDASTIVDQDAVAAWSQQMNRMGIPTQWRADDLIVECISVDRSVGDAHF